MSDTPETDHAALLPKDGANWSDVVLVEFSRKLERERDDLRAIFPKVLEALESGACAATCSLDFLREIPREVRLVRQRLERELVEAADDKSRLADMAIDFRRQRDDLRKALSLAGKLCHEVHHPKSMQHGDLDPCPVEALIQQALYKKP
jgi:hypothetical protein